MKIEIETYKGQEIFYDDEYDKFVCDISIEDKAKSTKRQSLNDVRKEIDVFIKNNAEFTPFKFICVSEYGGDEFKVKNAFSIRTDGKIIVGTESSSYKEHFGLKQTKLMMRYDQSIINELEAAEKYLAEARENYRNKVAELRSKLVPINLDKYKHLIEQTDETQTKS